MKKITEDIGLCKFDGVDVVTVYTGGINNLSIADLKWRKVYEEYLGEVEFLRLSEIVEQLKSKSILITIFINEPLKGTILQYGNYGNEWWEIGTTCGYA